MGHTEFDLDLDALIEASATAGQLAAGVNPEVVAARSAFGARGVAVLTNSSNDDTSKASRVNKAPKWRADEDEFLTRYLGVLSEQEIGDALGRSANAVHLRWKRDLHLPAPTRLVDWVTPNRASRMIGNDIHAVSAWIANGYLPAYKLPLDNGARAIPLKTFYRFVVTPRNWAFFDPARITDPYLRRLVALAQARWQDEWWTAQQAADYHGLSDPKTVIMNVQRGLIPADAVTRMGRANRKYLKSYIVAHHFEFIESQRNGIKEWSDRGDAFLVLGRACGMTVNALAAMLTNHYSLTRREIQRKRVPQKPLHTGMIPYRLEMLRTSGRMDALCARHRLQVLYDDAPSRTTSKSGTMRDGASPSDGNVLFADWKLYRERLPRLAAVMDKFQSSLSDETIVLSQREAETVRGVFAAWARYFGSPKILGSMGALNQLSLVRAYAKLTARGIDPFRRMNMPVIKTTTVTTFHIDLTEAEMSERINNPALMQRELRAALNGEGITTTDAPKGKTRKTHAKAKSFKCSACKETFPDKTALFAHKRTAHPVQPAKPETIAKSNGHLQHTEA